MASIVIIYDRERIWDEFLTRYAVRHEKICNDDTKFILYYIDEHHLMSISFQFGMFFQLKQIKETQNV
jgi:hypothetical protein